jgi:hypothetical protein
MSALRRRSSPRLTFSSARSHCYCSPPTMPPRPPTRQPLVTTSSVGARCSVGIRSCSCAPTRPDHRGGNLAEPRRLTAFGSWPSPSKTSRWQYRGLSCPSSRVSPTEPTRSYWPGHSRSDNRGTLDPASRSCRFSTGSARRNADHQSESLRPPGGQPLTIDGATFSPERVDTSRPIASDFMREAVPF